VMDGEVKASVEHEGVAIGSVQLRHCGATYDVPRIAGDRDDGQDPAGLMPNRADIRSSSASSETPWKSYRGV
jgi:hypothetical protein